ncbi:glycosyltransferase [Tahibacter sp.]|uniref:glycosyltransferase n=1 Tax=Tahibacter sp. TaxID=2056211 RepID=UPI0028C4C4DD|nr:glycosyltransferase [Tahibacter sp.]
MSRILLATLGSLGDLNPVLAMAKALEEAGHRVRVAANPMHTDTARRQGLEFVPLGQLADPTDLASHDRTSDVRDDAIAFVDHANFGQLDRLFDDLFAAADSADMLLAPHHVVPAHLVAAKRDIPWLAYTLSPAYLVEQTRLSDKRGSTPPLPPARWHAALAALRHRIGLPRRLFPYAAVFQDSPTILGLFPAFLLEPGITVNNLEVMGFPHSALVHTAHSADPGLLAFCDDRTVIFSFGSFVDRINPQHMFEQSVAACRALGLKCLYLSQFVGATAPDAGDVMIRGFVDHAAVFPRVGAIVHHAGVGTLIAACAAAKPMVTVPFLYDQPYHAQRMAALVDAPVLPAARYSRDTLVDALRQALEQAPVVSAQLAALMSKETNGTLQLVRAVAARSGVARAAPDAASERVWQPGRLTVVASEVLCDRERRSPLIGNQFLGRARESVPFDPAGLDAALIVDAGGRAAVEAEERAEG